jgi:hypothetical protein
MAKYDNNAESDSGKPNTIVTDEELIARFQDGDEYAFDQIVRRYKDPLLNFVYRCMPVKSIILLAQLHIEFLPLENLLLFLPTIYIEVLS